MSGPPTHAEPASTWPEGVDVRRSGADEVRQLQQHVLRPNGPLPADRSPPPDWVHLAAWAGNAMIGAASLGPAPWPRPDLAPLDRPTWQLRSMAVREDRRNRGIGSALLQAAVDLATESGAGFLWAEARIAALSLYQRGGWTITGPEWHKTGVGPHRYVVCRLADGP